MSRQRFPMYQSPAAFFDRDGGMPCANIFHRDHPGMVVLEIRGDFAVEYAREIIASEWFSSCEKTPPVEQRVLVMVLGLEYIGTFTRQGWVVDGYLRSGAQEPTHWRAMPAGPTP